MADGFRFPQSAGNFFFSQPHNPRQVTRNGSPAIRNPFATDTPSPSLTPDPQSPAQSFYGMYNNNHQGGQYGRTNGGARQQQGLHFNSPYAYQQQHQQQAQQQHQAQQQQQQAQQQQTHHQNIQQDHNAHATNGNLGHHTSYSGGGLNSSTPTFTPNTLPAGHSGTTRGGQAQQIPEHWAEQLQVHKECQKVHNTMMQDHASHHYARAKGHENRSIIPDMTPEDKEEDRGRPSNLVRPIKRQDWHNMDMSGQGLRVLAPPVFAYTFLNELYISSNRLTVLPAAIGTLRGLTHLDASNNLLTELPSELGMCVFLKQLLLFDNKITTLPNSLGYLYALDLLGIEGNPLKADLKQQIMEKGTKETIHHLRETITEDQESYGLDPNHRDMIDLQGGAQNTASDSFRVFSYNALCHKYATPGQYGYLPSGALVWDWRKNKVLEEIRERDADIVCLQEIDLHSYNEFFRNELAYNDYKGVYWQKTRATTMPEKEAKTVDGCATFFKRSKYILLDSQMINMSNLAINRPDMKGSPDVFNRVMPKDQIAVIAFLENRLTGSRLIVVNTHLEWSANFADVKVVQTAMILDSLSKAAEKYARWPACKDKKHYAFQDDPNGESEASTDTVVQPAPSMEYTSSTQIPLLFCGDFNSLRGSGVYDLIANGTLEKDNADFMGNKYGNFTRDGIQHPFSLRSAYSHLNGTANELPFTNYTPGFVGVIDYIWYSSNALEATKLLGPVNSEYLDRVPAFPTWHYPSDHLSLAAEFTVKGSGRKDKKAVTEPDFGPSRSRKD